MRKKGKGRVIHCFVINVPKKFLTGDVSGFPACRGAIDPHGWGIDVAFSLTLDDLEKVLGVEKKEPELPS